MRLGQLADGGRPFEETLDHGEAGRIAEGLEAQKQWIIRMVE